MINPQLLEYVRAQRSAGLSKDAIVQALAQGGWTPQDVNEAFMAIDGVQTPPPPPPAPAPVAPRVIIPPVQPSVAAAPAASAPVTRPVLAMSEFSTAHGVVKHSHWLLYTFLLVLLLGCIGLGAFLYMQPDFIRNMLGLGAPTPTLESELPPEAQFNGEEPIQILPSAEDNGSAPATTTQEDASAASSSASSSSPQ